VFNQIGAAIVAKTVCKPIHQIDGSIGRAQKQRSRIRRHQSGIERGFHSPTFDASKIKSFRATLCRHRGAPRIIGKSFSHNNFR